MTSPSEKLAESLEALRRLQNEGIIAIQASDLSRTHRERLLKNGFLQPVMKGWYIPSSQDETAGESTTWYASFFGIFALHILTNDLAINGAYHLNNLSLCTLETGRCQSSFLFDLQKDETKSLHYPIKHRFLMRNI